MTLDEINKASADARARAIIVAKRYADQARRAGATERDRLLGQIAALQVEIAEKRARLLDPKDAKRDLEEIAAWGDEQALALQKLCDREVAAGRSDFSTGPVKALQDRILSELDARRQETARKLANHVLDAWLAACDELSTLERPVGQMTSGSAAQH